MSVLQKTLVSVIVPIYNTENYLERTLDSLKSQTYKNIEIICINDASTDRSLDKIKNYKDLNNDLNIKIFENMTNSGLSFTRNKGIKNASGDYICFVDSDDYVSDDFIENLLSIAEKNSCDIVVGELRFENKDTHDFSPLSEINKKYKNFCSKLNAIMNGSVCDKLFKAKLIKENNLSFPIGLYYEDNEFLVKAIYYSKAIYKTNKASYFYCCNETSITHRKDNIEKKKESASLLLDHIFSFFIEKRITKRQEAALIDFCLRSFCKQFIKDDTFKLPNFLSKNKFIYILELPKYKNIFDKLFSLKRINETTKVITLFGFRIKFKKNKI